MKKEQRKSLKRASAGQKSPTRRTKGVEDSHSLSWDGFPLAPWDHVSIMAESEIIMTKLCQAHA